MKGEVKILSRYADGTPFRFLWKGRKEHSHWASMDLRDFLGGIETIGKYDISYEKIPNKKAYRKKMVEFIFKTEKTC